MLTNPPTTECPYQSRSNKIIMNELNEYKLNSTHSFAVSQRVFGIHDFIFVLVVARAAILRIPIDFRPPFAPPSSAQ